MFQLSLSPAIAPAFAPILTAPAVGTGDFALALAEVAAQAPAANDDANAIILPPDRQILAAPAILPASNLAPSNIPGLNLPVSNLQASTPPAPIPVLDPATPIVLPRFQPAAKQQTTSLPVAEPKSDAAPAAKSPARTVFLPAPVPAAVRAVPKVSGDRPSIARDDAPVLDDRDDMTEPTTLVVSALPIAQPVVQATPALLPASVPVAGAPVDRTPTVISRPAPIEPTAPARPDPVASKIADNPTPSAGLRPVDVPRPTEFAVPDGASAIAPTADQPAATVGVPIAFTTPPTPAPLIFRPGAIDHSPPLPAQVVTPDAPAPAVSVARPAIGVPVPALRAFAAAIAATSDRPVRALRIDEAPTVQPIIAGLPRTIASLPILPAQPSDAPTPSPVPASLPPQVAERAVARPLKSSDIASPSDRPVRLAGDDVAIATTLAVAAQPDLAARPAESLTRSLPPVDMHREDWTRALIDRIDAVRDVANARDTRITLIPDALGKIDVALRQDGETLHVSFAADAPATRALLADAQPRLAELAEARGLRLGDTAVSANPDGGRACNSFGQTADQRRPAPSPQASATNRSTSTNTAPDRADSDNRIA